MTAFKKFLCIVLSIPDLNTADVHSYDVCNKLQCKIQFSRNTHAQKKLFSHDLRLQRNIKETATVQACIDNLFCKNATLEFLLY